MWKKLFQNLKDILFPNFCVECGQEGEWWCKQCLAKLDNTVVGDCPVCGQVTDGSVCFNCRRQSALDGTVALLQYGDHLPIGKLIKLFKYHGARDVGALWSDLIFSKEQVIRARLHITKDTVIVPVPLHARRERERGFNQAKIIAEALSSVLAVPLENNFLKRIKYTSQQARLARDERFLNLQDAFIFAGAIGAKHIILVDDVYTTGATMQACARVLKNAGANNVWGFTLARGQ